MDVLNLKAIPVVHQTNVYSIGKKELDAVKTTKYTDHSNGFYISSTTSLLENKTLTSLKKFIINKAQEYTRDVLQITDQIYLTQSWSTINPTNAFHEPHDHPNTFISLVYYAQCKDAFLRFHLNSTSIKECFNFEYTINKFNIYNSQAWDIPVHTGDIVLFPGHIRHGSLPNKSPKPRIVVGANFFIKGTLGAHKNMSLITLS